MVAAGARHAPLPLSSEGEASAGTRCNVGNRYFANATQGRARPSHVVILQGNVLQSREVALGRRHPPCKRGYVCSIAADPTIEAADIGFVCRHAAVQTDNVGLGVTHTAAKRGETGRVRRHRLVRCEQLRTIHRVGGASRDLTAGDIRYPGSRRARQRQGRAASVIIFYRVGRCGRDCGTHLPDRGSIGVRRSVRDIDDLALLA